MRDVDMHPAVFDAPHDGADFSIVEPDCLTGEYVVEYFRQGAADRGWAPYLSVRDGDDRG
ncbi:hypothetical protein [Massilia aurea]|uniref:hypothetical protein n=1 Tax=Massilia aurea TaxID=373040 RepID=UPI001E2A2D9E|nr:hypothetical protein [Massilia aurea]